MPPNGRHPWSLLAGLLALVVAVHGSYFANGFVWLDHADIEAGWAIVDLEVLPHALLHRYGQTGFYRPLVSVFHSIDAKLWSQWAPGYHLTNVALHTAVTGATYLFVLTWFGVRPREGCLAALVVGVHPLSWLPVGSISHRPELLAVLFTLLALSFYVRMRRSGAVGEGMISLISAFLALLAKESAAGWMIGLVVLGRWMPWARRSSVRRQPVFLSAGCLVFVAYLGARLHAVPELWRSAHHDLPLGMAVGTRLAVWGTRLFEVVSPIRPPLSDATPVISWTDPEALAAGLVTALAAGVIWKLGLSALMSQSFVCVAVALAPALNLVPLPRFSSPHYGYLASVGAGLLAIVFERRLRGLRRRARWGGRLALGGWLLVMAGSTFAGGFRFRDDQTLFSAEVRADPYFREGSYYLGNFYREVGEMALAAKHYESALEAESPRVLSYVDEPSLLIHLAAVRRRQGRSAEADTLLERAEGISPSGLQFLIRYNRAVLASERGDFKAVIRFLDGEAEARKWHEPRALLEAARRQLDEAPPRRPSTLPGGEPLQEPGPSNPW